MTDHVVEALAAEQAEVQPKKNMAYGIYTVFLYFISRWN
jgi:hypothetical protein